MSVFGNIMSAIFGSKHAAGVTQAAPASRSGATTTAAAQPISRAEVEAILKKLAVEQRQDLDWGRLIVDLMKLLKLDSGIGARKQLAKELGYTGSLDGSAKMNIWLHKEVMTKLAESGGKVPDSLSAGEGVPTTQTLARILTDSGTVNRWYKQSVHDAADNKIGEIDDVLINREGKIVTLVVGVGGFLGMGEKHVAVPFNTIRATTKNNNPWHLVMHSTKEELKNAAAVKYDRVSMSWRPQDAPATTG